MKKFFTILGGIFAFLIVAAVIFFSITYYYGTGYDKESKLYVDLNLPQIIDNWKVEALTKRASPELMKVAPREKIEELFKVCSDKLGPMKEYKGSKGQSTIAFKAEKGKLITGAYVAEAIFEKAPATIKISIIKRNNDWQILEFFVNSDAMMPKL